jgi:hypothetical protein
MTFPISILPGTRGSVTPVARSLVDSFRVTDDDGRASDDGDVYLEYYSGKGFHINYSCLHVLRKTH